MSKTALFDCAINEKGCSVDREWGICPPFSLPPRGIWPPQESPPPGICHPRQKKKMLVPGRVGHSWNWLMHNIPNPELQVLNGNPRSWKTSYVILSVVLITYQAVGDAATAITGKGPSLTQTSTSKIKASSSGTSTDDVTRSLSS